MIKGIEKNYYSDELKEMLSVIMDNKKDILYVERILEMLFDESIAKMKLISPSHKTFFPTNKYNKGWKYGQIVGLVHVLSGGISIRKTIEWESSFVIYDKKDNSIINNMSSAFIIDLNGDILSTIDLTKVIEDRNGYNGTLSIKYVNAGLLKKRGEDFVWHGGSSNRWKMKYPYKSLTPVEIGNGDYYQPFSREQMFSTLLIHKLLNITFPDLIHVIGKTFFTRMLDVLAFSDVLNKKNSIDSYLSSFPSFNKL